MKSTILSFVGFEYHSGRILFQRFSAHIVVIFVQCDTHGHFFFGGPASSCKWGKQIVLGANGGHFILLGSHKNPRPKSELLTVFMMFFYFLSEQI